MAVAAAGCAEEEILYAAVPAEEEDELLEEIDRAATILREEEERKRRWLWREISRRDVFMVSVAYSSGMLCIYVMIIIICEIWNLLCHRRTTHHITAELLADFLRRASC